MVALTAKTAFEVPGSGATVLRGWSQGEGPAIILAHGITAHKDLVLHGSSHLARAGFTLVSYDARAHGESDPGEPGRYGYATLADDLEAVCAAQVAAGRRPILCGHSMGAHTVLAAALRDPERYAALIVIGPVSLGEIVPEERLAYWDSLADGLEQGGAEGWMAAFEAGGFDPEWRETLIRIARARIEVHQHPAALARALREVARDLPYDGLAPLEALELPALVVASHDIADPGHPYEVAAEIAERMPQATLISEVEGESPLAWQGGKLSRAIEQFADSEPVRARLGA